ncbi:uncharacterized protein LOC131657815 [Vicia villosa]|uniref:uncharacterized protein LOC131657815 n=1 Tax=Vicia villosa TaxID=3911 RepID=UPI00273AD605|nr:uncharacterized protein LOC131657815 [Vicia villosa]
MGFGDRWIKWMELLVFNSNMSVLVNGNPTKEFAVHRGLRQGDPLSPFLYVLVEEGLSGLIRQSIEVGEFESFNIKGECSVDIIFFNLRMTLYWWGREESIFYFLGIPIGFNPRKEATWDPLVIKLKNRLEGWTNRFLNLGGRITLLESDLSSLVIFTMSFYKMPRKVVKKYRAFKVGFYGGGG